jgi:tRNA A58 N-methylase Trm61
MPTLINRLASCFSAPCDEPEYRFLEHLAMDGACVIEVGAGVGQYTRRLSEFVGASGRVIAVECDLDAFAELASAAPAFRFRNVTLLHLDAAECLGAVVSLSLGTGLLKIDAADEWRVLTEMQPLIERDRPLLFVRTADNSEAVKLLKSWGYAVRRMPGSPNVIAEAR